MWYVYDVLYAVLYVRINCFVVRGCAVSIGMCLVLLMCTLMLAMLLDRSGCSLSSILHC